MKFSAHPCMVAAFSLAAIVAVCPAARAQSNDAHAILDKGVKATGLTGEDVPAWHLKATYTLYDIQKGSVTKSGTMEEWYSKPGVWHRVYAEKKLSGSEWSTSPAKQLSLKDDKLNVGQLNNQVARPLI